MTFYKRLMGKRDGVGSAVSICSGNHHGVVVSEAREVLKAKEKYAVVPLAQYLFLVIVWALSVFKRDTPCDDHAPWPVCLQASALSECTWMAALI